MYSLSRDLYIPDHTLTKIFNRTLLPQTAAYFHIEQPPIDVISWVSSLATASAKPTGSPKPLQPTSLVTGIDGENFSQTQAPQKNSWGGSHKNMKQLIEYRIVMKNKSSE